MYIKSDANNGQQYQKWLFAVSEINKIGIGFISIFLLKARVSYLTILKRKNLSLPLKDETDQFVTCLVLPECLFVKIAFHPRTVKRIVMAPMPSLLFRCFSLFLPHLRTLAQEKRSEIVFVLGLVGGVSVSVSIIVAKYPNIFPHPNNGRSRARKKKISGKAICSRHQRQSAPSRFGARLRYWIWLRGSASYVIMLHRTKFIAYLLNKDHPFIQRVPVKSAIPRMNKFQSYFYWT